MIFLKSIQLVGPRHTGYPFAVPAVIHLGALSLETPVTFFVGENGSGKSTLLEAIALATERVRIGASGESEWSASVQPLADALRVSWSRRAPRGFFFRAEDFVDLSRTAREVAREMQVYADAAERPQTKRFFEGERDAMPARYGGHLDELSHGEGFLRFFERRIVPEGLYLIDEPEAAFSPLRQLAMAFLIQRCAEESACQFIVATHSPVILSCPGAAIWEFTERGVQSRAFDDLEHVRLYRDFLANPGRFWREPG